VSSTCTFFEREGLSSVRQLEQVQVQFDIRLLVTTVFLKMIFRVRNIYM